MSNHENIKLTVKKFIIISAALLTFDQTENRFSNYLYQKLFWYSSNVCSVSK